MSKGMGGLPEGWATSTLGELAEYVNGRGFRKAEWSKSGRPIIRIQNLTGSNDVFNHYEGDLEDRHLVKKGDLLLSWAATLGVYEWAGPEGALNQHIFKVKPYIDRRFFRYLLQYKLQEVKARTQGSGMVHVTRGEFEAVPVLVPPLSEQRRIVEALEEQLSRLDAAERVLQVSRARIRALAARVANFAAARAVPANQPTAPLPREADAIDRDLPRIPASWSWERLSDIAEVVGGVTKDKKKQLDPDLAEVPYLRVANVQRGWLDLSHVATIRVPDKKAKDLRLKTGDVLMNEGGDRDKLGRGWVWRSEVKDAIHQNHVFRARVHGGILLSELLAYHANSSARWFEVNGKQTTNLASISLKKIRNLPIPVPPMGEQLGILQQISEQLDALTRAGAAVEVGLKRAVTLRSALLRKALTGNLVPQDPADEPATTLLARIASERDATKPARRAKPSREGARATSPRKTAVSRGRTTARAITDVAAPPASTPTHFPAASVQQELFDQ
ncbi:restriction endonuclease subunit S [Streptomyces sp. NPDC058411]|uniref:restriction endonuclease subunit S n=1 Tax=Streptomyces sp. NPDC058411 TaxID=3346485 RepID=UPI00365930BA